VRVMEVTVHQVVHVITVRDRFVAAVGAVTMAGFVPFRVVGRALRRVPAADLDPMLLHAVAGRMMQAAVVQVVRVAVVPHRGVAATGTVPMGVIFVVSVSVHAATLLPLKCTRDGRWRPQEACGQG
jgi:hypothetical protein